MAQVKQSLSEQRLAMFRKEGRGTGEGADYVPGRVLRDMPGAGRLHRFACSRCGGRQILLPSDAELAVFVKQYRDRRTCDLKEHLPLLDVKKTVWLAEQLGVRHPKLRDGSPAILITSLMVRKSETGSFQWQAIDIVSSREARQTPSDANLIKAEYWRRLGVQHCIEYSRGLNSHESMHLWTLFNIAESIVNRGISDVQKRAQQAVLAQLSRRAPLERRLSRDGPTLLALCHEVADCNAIPRAACVAAMHELIAIGVVDCPLDVPVLLAQRQGDVRVRIPFKRRRDTTSR